jgi:hypothetical protein
MQIDTPRWLREPSVKAATAMRPSLRLLSQERDFRQNLEKQASAAYTRSNERVTVKQVRPGAAINSRPAAVDPGTCTAGAQTVVMSGSAATLGPTIGSTLGCSCQPLAAAIDLPPDPLHALELTLDIMRDQAESFVAPMISWALAHGGAAATALSSSCSAAQMGWT